jgi:CDGSH iron-sulfur domain-containing protein 3
MKLVVRENGSVGIETPNGYIIRRGETEEVVEKPRLSLCRCGHSNNKPFCDGAHKAAGFVGEPLEIELR